MSQSLHYREKRALCQESFSGSAKDKVEWVIITGRPSMLWVPSLLWRCWSGDKNGLLWMARPILG